MKPPLDIWDIDEAMEGLLKHADAVAAAEQARALLTRLDVVDPRVGPTLDRILDHFTDIIRRSEGTAE